jgi:hypothetical protein
MLDAALISNVVASALMNGLCCVHAMQEEEAKREEHKEMLRNAVKVEWERQRVLDSEIRERQLRGQGLVDASILAEHRRRQLMSTKLEASRKNLPGGSLDGQHNTQDGSYRHCEIDSTPKTSNRHQTFATPTKSIVAPSTLSHRIRSAPVWSRDCTVSRMLSTVSSLLDDGDEDDADEDLDEISLQ